ncbi:hypothetical protein [Aeromonas sobria]|uniref:hypothetical protein n=1 Tax=Aeromonas sobria TaxID=646 RepID=UPI0011DF2639|nr:hypothetical protein [Aeromonas sobria]
MLSRYIFLLIGKMVVLFFVLFSATLSATYRITAEYKPGSEKDPRGDRFINTTPCDYAGYTEPDFCNKNNIFEDFTIIKLLSAVSVTGSDGVLASFKTGGPRTVTLTNTRNLEQHMVTFIPTHIGATAFGKIKFYEKPLPFDKVVGDCKKKFEGRGVIEVSDQFGVSYLTERIFLYNINTDAQSRVAECTVTWPFKGDIPLHLLFINYGFKLEMPNPLKMSNGTYTGVLNIRSDRDIYLGPKSLFGSINEDLLFTLTVAHQLKVVFPASEGVNSSRVTLLPAGGWSQPLSKNFSIQQKLPLRISYSSPYTLSILCQYKKDNSCALKNSQGDTVKLDTTYIDEVNNYRLLSSVYPTKIEMPANANGKVTVDKEAFMLFRVEQGEVKKMLGFPGSKYKGDVTFVFDASI